MYRLAGDKLNSVQIRCGHTNEGRRYRDAFINAHYDAFMNTCKNAFKNTTCKDVEVQDIPLLRFSYDRSANKCIPLERLPKAVKSSMH